MGNMQERPRKSSISRADSLTILGIVVTILFFALIPSFLVKALCVLTGATLLIFLVWRSDYLNSWRKPKKSALAVALVSVVIVVAITQLHDQWKESHRAPEASGEMPAVTWSDPPPINFGTPLSGAQLNAKSPIEGTFVYNPTTGATLPTGTNTLSVTFFPKDPKKYMQQTRTVAIVVKPQPKPPAKKLAPLTLASHKFLIESSGTGYNAVLKVYLNNNTGVVLKTRDRSTSGMFDLPMNSPKREEVEDNLWTEMSKRDGNIREITTTPDTFIEFPFARLSEQDLKQLRDGKTHLSLMVDIRTADDKKRLLELCGYVNGPNELLNCNKHNWP